METVSASVFLSMIHLAFFTDRDYIPPVQVSLLKNNLSLNFWPLEFNIINVQIDSEILFITFLLFGIFLFVVGVVFVFLFFDRVLFSSPGCSGTCSVTQTGLELWIIFLPPKCHDYRYMSPCPTFMIFYLFFFFK